MVTTPDMRSVLRALDGADTHSNDRPDQYTSKNGIVFRLKPVPPLLIVDAQKVHKEPKPPKVLIEDKGTQEENPNDPEYQRQLAEHRATIAEISNAVILTRGSEVLSVPDGLDKPSDPDWAEDVHDLTGIEVPEKGRRRYFCWMKYVALSSMDDFQEIVQRISRLGGITMEVDVAEAEARFRPDEEGNTPVGVRARPQTKRGDSAPAADAGDSA